MDNPLDQLQDAIQTTITTADGEEMVLFHYEPITQEEVKEFEKLTRQEIIMILKLSFKFDEVKL